MATSRSRSPSTSANCTLASGLTRKMQCSQVQDGTMLYLKKLEQWAWNQCLAGFPWQGISLMYKLSCYNKGLGLLPWKTDIAVALAWWHGIIHLSRTKEYSWNLKEWRMFPFKMLSPAQAILVLYLLEGKYPKSKVYPLGQSVGGWKTVCVRFPLTATAKIICHSSKARIRDGARYMVFIKLFSKKLQLFRTIKSWEPEASTFMSPFIMFYKALMLGKDNMILSNSQKNSSWTDL